MPGGPFYPESFEPGPNSAGEVFRFEYYGNTNGRALAGLGVKADISADRTAHLLYRLPRTLPTSGTLKLRLAVMANAVAGNAVINPAWASVAAEENFDTIALNAIGNTTIAFAAGDVDVFKEVDIAMTGDTPVAGEWIVMVLTFVDASWTLASDLLLPTPPLEWI